VRRYLFNSSQCCLRRSGQSASICLAIDARRPAGASRLNARQRYSDSAAAQVTRHIRQIEINMFRGARAARLCSCPQLTESSRPADASGYARYQKPISLVLPCADDRRNQGKANGQRA